MAETPQNFSNHVRYDPIFHFFLMPVFVTTFISTVVFAIQHSNLLTWLHVVLALAALFALFRMRIYSMKVQDRVIRLEERIRLSAILADPLRGRISELTVKQLVALRFASDGDVAGLVQKALDGMDPKAIKQAIVNWRRDDMRV